MLDKATIKSLPVTNSFDDNNNNVWLGFTKIVNKPKYTTNYFNTPPQIRA